MPDIVFLNSIQLPKRQTIFVLFMLENKAQALDLSVDSNFFFFKFSTVNTANFQFLLAEALVLGAVRDSVTTRSYLVNFPLKTSFKLPPHLWPQSFHHRTERFKKNSRNGLGSQ